MEPVQDKIVSNIHWKDESNGSFVLSENRGKAAIGFIKKSAGKLDITLVENEYNPKYLKRKVHRFVNEQIKEQLDLKINKLSLHELYNYDVLITTSQTGVGLTVGKRYRFDKAVTNFLVDGLLDCNGRNLAPPIVVEFAGTFRDRCAPGMSSKEYCKYIIIG